LNKIGSEEARVSATEKARLAEEEKARLAAEGARQAEQAKAAAAAKAAEVARLAAEKAKQLQQEKVAAAEQARATAEKLAAEKLAAQKAAAEKLAADKAEAAKAAEEKAAAEKAKSGQQVAALSPTGNEAKPALSGTDIARALQTELRRVGCNAGSIDGNWNSPSQRSLDLFNKHAGLNLDVKIASVDALDAVKAKANRVCPLICEHGFKADGDRCAKITCRSGYEVGDDNTCEKVEAKKPTVKRDEPKRDRAERARTEAAPAKPQASGQILCTPQGCRPVAKGCRLVANEGARQQQFNMASREVCD
jgi:hypothetical protein